MGGRKFPSGSWGKFSRERYRQLLQGQGLTPAGFEQQVRTNIVLEQVRSVYSGSAFVAEAVAERLLKIREQEREVSQVLYSPADYRSQVKISDADVERY